MERLLESVLKDDAETTKSDFLKIFYSCLEDESFQDEFHAYMKQYMFHFLKQSKLKSITEPTEAIRCHSVSPKIQAMNLLLADYLLRQDFLYTLSVFSSEAPNLKNLTSFYHYINCLANKKSSSYFQPINQTPPKLVSKDVKDILECLGLSPHCEESVEARQLYMDCEEGEPLILCLLSSLVSALQSITRCSRCKTSYDNQRSQNYDNHRSQNYDNQKSQNYDNQKSHNSDNQRYYNYKNQRSHDYDNQGSHNMSNDYQDNSSCHIAEFNVWQNEICQLLYSYGVNKLEVIELVQSMTVILNKELEDAGNQMTFQLTKKENQLRKQEEILDENLEEAERHLLAQKQSLEKELARKQRELQEVAQILRKKKANISEAVNILQKQKDLLTEKEKEFRSKIKALDEQLEQKAHNLKVREREIKEGFHKLNKEKESFYEEILKLCSHKVEKNVNLNQKKLNMKSKGITMDFTEANEKDANTDQTDTCEEDVDEINSQTPRKNHVRKSTGHNSESKSMKGNTKDNRNENYDHHTVEDNINRFDSRELIALLKTIQVQSEAMKEFLEERHRDDSDQNNIPTTQFQYQPKSNTGIESRPQPNILSRILKDKDQPNVSRTRHVLIDSCRVNDENTICDRCGSEVILKFHINGMGQESKCDKSVPSKLNQHMSPVRNSNEEKRDNRTLADKSDIGIMGVSEIEDTAKLQAQMTELMARFENFSTNHNRYTPLSPNHNSGLDRNSTKNTGFSRNKQYSEKYGISHETPLEQKQETNLASNRNKLPGQHHGHIVQESLYTKNQGLPDQIPSISSKVTTTDSSVDVHSLDTRRHDETHYINEDINSTDDPRRYGREPIDSQMNIEDPVDLSRKTLARLSSQISALDESYDRYRDNTRKENTRISSGEHLDLKHARQLLNNDSIVGNHHAGSILQPSPTRLSQLHKSTSHRFDADAMTRFSTLHKNRSHNFQEKFSTLHNFRSNRTGVIHSTPGQHQATPPYFGANIPFWQSYLKTYHIPTNKKLSWQEHFQAFASQVDRDNETNNGDPQFEEINPNGNKNNEDARDEVRKMTREFDSKILNGVNDSEEQTMASKMMNKKTDDIVQTNPKTDEVLQIHDPDEKSNNQFSDRDEQIVQINNMVAQNARIPNKSGGGNVGNSNQVVDKEDIPETHNLDSNQLHIEWDLNAKQKYWRDENNILKEKSAKDSLLGNFNIAKENVANGTNALQRRYSLDANKDTQSNLDNNRDDVKNKKNNAVADGENKDTRDNNFKTKEAKLREEMLTKDMNNGEIKDMSKDNDVNDIPKDDEGIKDNSVVEYNPAGSLLFQLQDSDESIS